jgi:spore germination protein GerM
MSDDRMRELARRVVGMAPEAPHYDAVASEPLRPTPPPRRSPWLAVALGAAAAIVLVAVPLWLAGRGGTAPETQQTTTATAARTTTVEEATTTTVVAIAMADAVFYLAAPTEASIAGNPTMVPVHRVVSAEGYELHVVEALLEGATASDPAGTFTVIPPGVELRGVSDIGGPILTIDFTAPFAAGSGSGLLGDLTMLNQIVFTATALPGVEAVEFMVEGQPDPVFGTEGLILDGPVDRTTFADESLALIVLDQPVHGAPAGEEITISGSANVFEATVSYEIVEDAGAVLHEGFITASCGTGCWGDFTETVAITRAAGRVVVYWESAEDGSRHDVIVRDIG